MVERLDVGGEDFGAVGVVRAAVGGVVVDEEDVDAAGWLEHGEDRVILESFAAVDEVEFFLGGNEVVAVGDGGRGCVVEEGVGVDGVKITGS